MLSPRKIKHRKVQRRFKRRLGGVATRGNRVSFGEFGLITLESSIITNRQLEAARIALSRHIRRGGKIWIRVFPDLPYTRKPAETRMGKGKGNPEAWVAAVKSGKILFELAGVAPELARSALRLAAQKLPVATKFVTRI